MKYEPHPVCRQLRNLRRACGWSLPQAEQHIGVPGMVLGTYERGDRNPPLLKLEEILNAYGYTLAAIPKDFDAVRLTGSMVAELRNIASQLELQQIADNHG